jgi:hypothetical protein
VTAGAAISPAVQVTVRDAFGNRVTSANNSITLSFLQAGRGTPSNNVVPASAGIATFTNLNTTKATTTGSGQTQLLTPDSLIATATSLTPDTSSGFAVNPAAISAGTSTLTTPQPTDSACSTPCTTGGGTASILTVTARDQFSNVIQGLTVSMSSTGGPGNTFTAPPNTNSSGVSTSTFNSTKAEAKTISATVGGVLVTPTASVTVIPAGVNATHSSLARGLATITACQTSCSTAGGTGSLITVTARDAFDNLIQNAKVVLSATGSNPVFSPAPPNTNGSGVSTSTFSSTTAEGKTISGTLQVGSGTIVSVTQTQPVTVAADVAAQLSFTTQPTNTVNGQHINQGTGIIVTAFDQFGNVATGYTGSVTLSITSGTGTGGASLSGPTNPVTAVAGVAQFSNMSIDLAGTQYTLDASDGSLSTTSNQFDIT